MKMVKPVNLTPEVIAVTLDNEIDKKVTLKLLNAFLENGLTYKARTAWKSKDDMSPDNYRVFCYIKKSKEAMILNTKSYVTGSFSLQIRILDSSTFDKLDEYSENIRNQILNAHDCGFNGCGGCEKYMFTYKGQTYKKCNNIGNNFLFCNFIDEDIGSLMNIINREIMYSMPKRKV